MMNRFYDVNVKSYGYGIYQLDCPEITCYLDYHNEIMNVAASFGTVLRKIVCKNSVFIVVEQETVPCHYQIEYAKEDLKLMDSIAEWHPLFDERLRKIKSHF